LRAECSALISEIGFGSSELSSSHCIEVDEQMMRGNVAIVNEMEF
jgi:hypothetical protein